MKQTAPVDDQHSIALHESIASLLRQFKLEPGVLAGSAYADLHVNDVGLLQVLDEPGEWSVQKIAHELRAPISTISSALDRLESRRIISRRRSPADRRAVLIELTAIGVRLATRLRATQVENCRLMLTRLTLPERKQLLRLVAQMAGG